MSATLPDRPNPFQPPTSSTSLDPRYRSLSGLTTWVTVVYAIEALLITLAAATGVLTARRAPEVLVTGTLPSDPSVSGIAALYIGAEIATFFVTLAGIVVFLLWLHRSVDNTDVLVPGGIFTTPGWAVGWYFVPILNLWRPFQVMKELYIASDPDVDPEFRMAASTPIWLSLWWVSWILYYLSGRATDSSTDAFGLVLNGLFGVVAALFVVHLVRKIRDMQEMKLRTGSSRG